MAHYLSRISQYGKTRINEGGGSRLTTAKHSIITTDPLMNQIDHFCSVIKGNKPPLISAEEGFKNLKVLEGIYESAESGETFKIT